ncbi:MAG: hypothetical protein ACRD3O_20675 [Terriglobia bacterium]
MSKSMDRNKETKKKRAKTMLEKRAASTQRKGSNGLKYPGGV